MPPQVFLANRPDPEPPRSAGERLRAAVDEGLFRVRQFAAETWSDFRRRDRWFQMKVGVIAAWALTSALAIRLAMGGPGELAANALHAYVALNSTTMSWGLLVHNRSDEDWTGVRVILDGGWVHERPSIAAGERVVLSPAQFARDGAPAPANLEVASVRIETEEGSAQPAIVR